MIFLLKTDFSKRLRRFAWQNRSYFNLASRLQRVFWLSNGQIGICAYAKLHVSRHPFFPSLSMPQIIWQRWCRMELVSVIIINLVKIGIVHFNSKFSVLHYSCLIHSRLPETRYAQTSLTSIRNKARITQQSTQYNCQITSRKQNKMNNVALLFFTVNRSIFIVLHHWSAHPRAFAWEILPLQKNAWRTV